MAVVRCLKDQTIVPGAPQKFMVPGFVGCVVGTWRTYIQSVTDVAVMLVMMVTA